jgi:hypothetical protein
VSDVLRMATAAAAVVVVVSDSLLAAVLPEGAALPFDNVKTMR